MLKIGKSITLTGESFVELNDENGEPNGQRLPVANMYASISEAGTPSITKNITDKNLYLEHKEVVDSDMDEFEHTVLALVQ